MFIVLTKLGRQASAGCNEGKWTMKDMYAPQLSSGKNDSMIEFRCSMYYFVYGVSNA